MNSGAIGHRNTRGWVWGGTGLIINKRLFVPFDIPYGKDLGGDPGWDGWSG